MSFFRPVQKREGRKGRREEQQGSFRRKTGLAKRKRNFSQERADDEGRKRGGEGAGKKIIISWQINKRKNPRGYSYHAGQVRSTRTFSWVIWGSTMSDTQHARKDTRSP